MKKQHKNESYQDFKDRRKESNKRRRQSDSASGDKLNRMRKFLIDEKIPFDFINENPLVDFGSRKIFAHEYYDDRNKKLTEEL